MQNFKIKLILTVSILLSVSLTALPQEEVNLQYQMSKGKTFLYKSDIATNITQEAMGRKMKINNDIHSIGRIKVEDIDDNGDINLLISYDSITVHNQMPGRDSTMVLNDLIGKRTKLVMTKYGKTLSKKQLDTLSHEGQIMSSSLMHGAANYFIKLPGKEIKTGDTWTADKIDSITTMGSNIVINQNIIYKLGNKEDKNGISCYKISYSATLSSKGKANMQGYEFYVDGNGKVSGDIYLSADDCSVVKIESKNENETTLAATGQQNMIIPISQSSTITTNLISK